MAIATLLPRKDDRRTSHLPEGRKHWFAASLPRQNVPASIRVPGLTRDIRVQIASTRDEWEQAFQLVADNYQARGYEAGECDYRFTSYHALPETRVLVATEGTRVVATMSLVFDNTLLGLPIETLYQPEIRQLRRRGGRLAETTNLAARDLGLREFPAVFLALIRLAMQYHAVHAGEEWNWVITVNPRHRTFYTKLLGFVPLGPWRAYPAVCGHPAEAYFLDAKLMQVKAAQTYQQIFGQPLPPNTLNAPRMPAGLIRHFARHSSQTDPRLIDEILNYFTMFDGLRR